MTREVTNTQVERMWSLYQGLRCAYGTYDLSNSFYEGKKLKGAPTSVLEATAGKVFDKPFWSNKIKEHLQDGVGVGIVPVNEEAKCYWGCIDIDKYDLNYEDVLRRIAKKQFPLVTTVSKSGGLHLWLFMKAPAAAFLVINYLKNVKADLGMADVEVFPKQTKILFEQGDSGSWVNIPMLGDGTRYGIRLVDEKVEEIKDLDTFLDYAESIRLDKLTTSEIEVKQEQAVPVGIFKEAPPCLKALMAEGFPTGTRNIIMYNVGVYLKKVHGDLWQPEFDKFNQMHCEEPLSASEVMTLQKSLDKKEYHYMCSTQPLCAYCNVSKCRIAKFGIQNQVSDLQIENLAKLDAKPAIWFATIGESRMQLTSDQLQDQKKFQLACMEELNRMPVRMKEADWAVVLDALIQDAIIIPAAPDAGTDGIFSYHLDEYCSTMASDNREDLLRKRAFRSKEDGFTYFSLTDFMKFLKQNGFRDYTQSGVSAKLKDMKGGTRFFNILGKGINTHYVPNFATQESKFTIPEEITQSEDII